MTPDPVTAALDQLAAHHEHITSLDTRESSHFAEISGQVAQLTAMITTISRTLAEDTTAMARLDALDRQVTELTGKPRPDGADGYMPTPAPPLWKLTPDQRRHLITELRAWVDQVYRPGYGHLAATLRPCWDQHDLCLYGIDILSQLWSVLYLQPQRSSGMLSAQAEYQARILPALATQLMTETTRCEHAYARRTP